MNHINDVGASALVVALERNTHTLLQLAIWDNNISDDMFARVISKWQ